MSDNKDELAEAGGPEPGTVIAGKYELVRYLGGGGMGSVWLARHRDLRTEVAVKLWRGQRADSDSEWREHGLERFRLEAQISAQLGLRSRHVVRAHDVGVDAVGPYLVMDYVRGASLADEIRAHGRLAPDRAAAILGHTADALAVAHELGIVHRDLKPENLLLGTAADGSLEVKVLDFGVAKVKGSPLPLLEVKATTEGTLVGTLDYMAPEQLFGVPIDQRVDCWALGVIAFEMITGKNPFGSPAATVVMQRILTDAVPRPSMLVRGLPRELDAWFARALEKERDRRFASVRDMAVRFLASLPPPSDTVVMVRPQFAPTIREANGVSVPALVSTCTSRTRPPTARRGSTKRRVAFGVLATAIAGGVALASAGASSARARSPARTIAAHVARDTSARLPEEIAAAPASTDLPATEDPQSSSLDRRRAPTSADRPAASRNGAPTAPSAPANGRPSSEDPSGRL